PCCGSVFFRRKQSTRTPSSGKIDTSGNARQSSHWSFRSMAPTRFVRSAPVFVVCLLLAGFAASAQKPEQPEFKAPQLKPPLEKLPAIFSKSSPEKVEDLKAIQDHVAKLVDKVTPATVSMRIGAGFGSGVIVSKDGYVLTAGHVSGKPGRDVVIYLHNGKTAKGKTLGGNHGIDSGM